MKTIKTIGFLVLMILSSTINAQPWSVNPNDFQFSMTVTGEVSVAGDIINQQDAYIGAFVEGECRGVSPTSEDGGNYKLFFITIYSNDVEGEVVEFKLMDENDVETAMANTIQFKNDANYGSADSPFLWMDVEQYASTDFLTFALDSQITTANIDATSRSISIIVSKETNRRTLIPIFTLASGAVAYISDVEQISNETENDYSDVVHYLVTGVDGAEADWSVEVKTDNSGIKELKSNSLSIYPNPAKNKVQLTVDNEQLGENIQILDITGKRVKQIKIQNTRLKIQIEDLKSGIYFVKIKGLTKKLIIE